MSHIDGLPDGSAGDDGPAREVDLVRPFMLESSGIRGRLVRLGPLLDKILQRHDYPEAVEALLAELLVLASGLSSLLKYDGVFTLQTKGDGPVHLAVADVSSLGVLRGYAGYAAERAAAVVPPVPTHPASVEQLLGQGYLAFTVDQGPGSQRYQGIVELTGESLADCLQHYFQQSEQVQTGILLSTRREPSGWKAACLILQFLPEDESPDQTLQQDEDDWRRAMVLQASCTSDELLDTDLPMNDLLYRLFNEEGVRVFDSRALLEGCRCGRDKLFDVLRAFPRDDLEHLKVDGRIVMVCEFCNREYRFDDNDLDRLKAG